MPHSKVCDVSIPEIKSCLRQRENFRKDRNSYKRRLANAKKKSKIDQNKIQHLIEKLSRAEDVFNDFDQTCKDAIRELLGQRPQLLLALTGFMVSIEEFFVRSHNFAKLSSQFLPTEESAFFKMSIASKLSQEDGTDANVIISPEYISVKTGLKSIRDTQRRHSGLVQTQKTATVVKPEIEADQAEVDDLHDVGSVEVAFSDSRRSENHDNEQDEIIGKPSFEVNEDDPEERPQIVNSFDSGTTDGSLDNDFIDNDEYSNTNPLQEEWDTEDTHNDNGVPQKIFSVVALYDYDGVGEEELSFKAGDIIKVLENDESGWAAGEIESKAKDAATDDSELHSTRRGLFPMNYVRVTM